MQTTKPEKPTGAKEEKRMKSQKVKRKFLPEGDHQCLSAKEVMDGILQEGDALPAQVRHSLAAARDAAWSCFVEQQEKINQTTR
jgi:hypothetical protein